jgi:hypothetical protein
MAYLSGFEEDVFISYASLDDKPLLGDRAGWVTQLHENLTARLIQRLGADNVRLWRDIEIRNNEDFTNKIEGRLAKTAALLSVLSPGFLKRQWTVRELKTFVEHAQGGVGLLVKGEKSRIFKVEKLEVPRDALPPPMQGTRSYKFHGPDPEHPRISREFWPQIDRSNYLRKLDELAYDIANLLLEMQGPASSEERVVVYLAETTSDLEDELIAMRRELTDHGYIVLPEGDLPHRSNKYIEEVRKNLKLATMSVHLIGEKYGLIPEGEIRSTVRIQHDLALERNGEPNFTRFVWMPPGLKPAEDGQRVFVQYLQNDPNVQSGAEIMETSFEDLKSAVRDKLETIKHAQESAKSHAPSGSAAVANGFAALPPLIDPAARPDDPLMVYIICDKGDLGSEQLTELKNHVYSLGYEVLLPTESSFTGGSLTRHLNNLKVCDAFLIFYGTGSVDWCSEKLIDYHQYLRGRSPRVVAKAIYLAAPDTDAKREFRSNAVLVLRGGMKFSAADLEPFVQQLRLAPRGS